MHSTRCGNLPAELGSPIPDRLHHVVLLEDLPEIRERLTGHLKSEKFIVHDAHSQEECLEYLDYGCRTFLLDIHMGEKKKIEGLQTLQEIKHRCKEAFCAIVSARIAEYEERARNLGADYICDKEPSDLEGLIDKMNLVFLERQPPQAIRQICRDLRAGQTLEGDLRGKFAYIDAAVAAGDEQASLKLVLLERELSVLVDQASEHGDGFGIAALGLWNAVLHHQGQELTHGQWTAWKHVFDQIMQQPKLLTLTACELVERLEDEGFKTEPPGWTNMNDIFDHDDRRIS